MARYSREQRRRAVELYERYEHSAADVIRELGYPSKGALLMWYREWLEERRTGVPSRRGERYARYTDEQKRAAVDHCLTHGRRSGRTMRRMGYPSHEVLAAWTGRAGAVFCQAVVVHCGVSFQSEKAGEISPFRHRSCLVLVWLLHEGVGLAVGVALESDHPAVVDGAVD